MKRSPRGTTALALPPHLAAACIYAGRARTGAASVLSPPLGILADLVNPGRMR